MSMPAATRELTDQETLDTARRGQVNSFHTEVAPNAMVPLPCVSHSGETQEISSSKIGWGGARANSGGPRANSGGSRANSGGKRTGAGRKRKRKEFVDPPPIELPTSPGCHWYCVETAEYREALAAADIRSLGLPVLFVQARERIGGKRGGKPGIEKLTPRFRRYLFVAFDMAEEPWKLIHTCRGDPRLLGLSPDQPARVPQELIDKLLAKCEPNGVLFKERPERKQHALFEVGAAVQVLDGPFTSFPGTVLESDEKRLLVSVYIFGRSTPVELRYTDVRQI